MVYRFIAIPDESPPVNCGSNAIAFAIVAATAFSHSINLTVFIGTTQAVVPDSALGLRRKATAHAPLAADKNDCLSRPMDKAVQDRISQISAVADGLVLARATDPRVGRTARGRTARPLAMHGLHGLGAVAA